MTVVDRPPTRPATTAPAAAPARSRIARWNAAALDRLGALTATQLAVMIWVSALIMCFTLLGSSRTTINGTMNIVENWGAVERVALWQDFLEPVIPRFTLPTGVIAWGFRAGMVLGFLAQIGAFLVVLRAKNPSLMRWLIGPIGAHVIMALLMIPSNSDVFFYEAVGNLAANGINPYVHHLIEFPDNPLLPYNYWVDIGTVYGPHWVNYNAIVMAITGPDPVVATLVQKVLSGLTTFALVWLVYWLSKRLSGSQSLAAAAGVLVAWQPNMILESSGQVHNDPLVVLLATAGLALVIAGGVGALRGGIVLVSLSIMVKFITLPLLGVLALIRLTERRRPDAVRRILGGWLLDGVAILAVFAGAFLPYWEGFKTVQEMLAEPSRLYTHPIWRFIQSALGFLFPHQVSDAYNAITRPLLQVLTFVLFGWVIYRLVMALWNGRETVAVAADGDVIPDALPWWTKPVLVAWTAMFCILGFLPVNSHPWYWVWPVVPIATLVAFLLRDERPPDRIARMPGWFWLYVWGNGLLTVMYHTRIARY